MIVSNGVEYVFMEFFVITDSNAAPFCSDRGERYIEAADAQEAVRLTRANYKHPVGLYALAVYASADAYHKRQPILAEWACKRAQMRNGIDCPECGAKTSAVILNLNDHFDVHRCPNGHRTQIDMSLVRDAAP